MATQYLANLDLKKICSGHSHTVIEDGFRISPIGLSRKVLTIYIDLTIPWSVEGWSSTFNAGLEDKTARKKTRRLCLQDSRVQICG